MCWRVVGIPLGAGCAGYERDFVVSLSVGRLAGVVDAFNTTSRYLDTILKIDNVYFDNMVSQIYPSGLQLNRAGTSDAEFLDLSISNDIVPTKIYDGRDNFDFEIVSVPFLDGDVPHSASYGVNVSQLIALLDRLAVLLALALTKNF